MKRAHENIFSSFHKYARVYIPIFRCNIFLCLQLNWMFLFQIDETETLRAMVDQNNKESEIKDLENKEIEAAEAEAKEIEAQIGEAEKEEIGEAEKAPEDGMVNL